MDLQFKSVPFDIKTSSSDGSTGEGLASVFYNCDSYREIVDDGAFDEDLPAFLADGFVGGINHNWDCPIGTPTTAKTDKTGLRVGWKLSDTMHGRDCMVLMKDRVIKKLSIGYQTLGREILETFDDVMTYWKGKGYTPNAQDISRAQAGAVLLTRLKLYEFSPVSVPANDLAAITAVKAAAAKAMLNGEPPPGEAAPATETPTEPPATERLEKIRAIATDADAEDCLRDAGFSRTERKALLSRLKTLLRDAVSDDADPAPDDAQADEPAVEPDADTPPPTDDAPPASETLSEEGGKSDEGAAAIVTHRRPDPDAPLGLDLLNEKRDLARLLYAQKQALDAKIDGDLARLPLELSKT